LLVGGPTLVGSLVGHAVTTKAASVMLLTLAAGSILYVAIGLLGLAEPAQHGHSAPGTNCPGAPADGGVSQGTVACRTASVSASVRKRRFDHRLRP
jgi:hypothetical protein